MDRQREEELDQAPAQAIFTDGRRAEGLRNAVVPQNDMEGYAREIGRLWHEARDKFMAIGEYLIMAKERLAHGEYEEMIRARLPFSTSAAHKMRSVAEAVHSGRVPRDQLPYSYATAYELTQLKPSEMRIAETRGLVRPTVYLREIQALRAELRAPVGSQRFEAMRRERQRLANEIDRLKARIDELDAALLEEGSSHSGSRIIEGKAAKILED
ncbi:hypothetical protein [Roseomonas sp. KE0001]|uniref:hypothetical protein n=1 Tax=Roseomonas sp. KE0001 TaxID=2479201 RepID=UPI0018DF43A4|nr:hypothetical protein [Roseomonas sp. KE0001]